MKKRWFILSHLMVALLSPILVVEGFGHYTQWKIHKMDEARQANPYKGAAAPQQKYTAEEIEEMKAIISDYRMDHEPLNEFLRQDDRR